MLNVTRRDYILSRYNDGVANGGQHRAREHSLAIAVCLVASLLPLPPGVAVGVNDLPFGEHQAVSVTLLGGSIDGVVRKMRSVRASAAMNGQRIASVPSANG